MKKKLADLSVYSLAWLYVFFVAHGVFIFALFFAPRSPGSHGALEFWTEHWYNKALGFIPKSMFERLKT